MAWATSGTRSTAVFTSTMAVITLRRLARASRAVHRPQAAPVSEWVGIGLEFDSEVEEDSLPARAVSRTRPRTVDFHEPDAGRIEPPQDALDLFRTGRRGSARGHGAVENHRLSRGDQRVDVRSRRRTRGDRAGRC